nr:Dna2/Cas4 domain-containing protein [Bacteroidales bacterium]
EQSNVSKWFDTTYRIQTEQGISTPEGEKRPDRLVFTEANTIEVIDYKFTLETQTKHIQQVQEYVRVLQSMGYTVTGYVWYVLLHKVLEV